MPYRADAPRVGVRTLGCKVNRTESEALASLLLGDGVTLADEAPWEVVVVNTCTVTGEADAKARKEVRRALAAPGAPVVVVTGCLAAIDAAGLAALGERVVVEPDRERLAARVFGLLGRATPAPDAEAREGAAFRTRVMLKVQDGCDNRCAYCIVPDARGLPRSVPAARVLARAAALAASGTREVVLTGVNIGRYRDGDTDLAGLVAGIAASGVARVRISSIEPPDLTADLLSRLAGTGVVMPHLHVPLQSGSDAVLAAMGRRYTAADYADAIARAREALPGVAVTADVIAGFPGERDADHADTVALARACGLAGLHVFRFSPRSGTPAAAMAGRVAPELLRSRADELRALSREAGDAWVRARVGTAAAVLVEEVRGGVATGRAEDHLRVSFPCGEAATAVRVGDVVTVTVTGRAEGGATAPRARGVLRVAAAG